MPKPGFVLEVQANSRPTLVWRGEHFASLKLPTGSRVIYGPEPIAPLKDATATINSALESPTGAPALRDHLKAGMKLTIAFDDNSSPLLPTLEPDARQLIIEAILEMAAVAAIDDVELIVARGINRRLYDNELRQMLGERIYDSFAPKGWLTQHNADDADYLTEIGSTKSGDAVQLNKRVVESDLLIYVGVDACALDGGWKNIAAGLGSTTTNRLMRKAEAIEDIANILKSKLSVFQVEATLDNRTFPRHARFLEDRESQWSLRDRAAFALGSGASGLLPQRANRGLFTTLRSPQAITGIFAGEVDAAHANAVLKVNEQQLTRVDGQSDVVSVGIPYNGPFAAGAVMNPVLVAYAALGYYLGLNTGTSLVRDGGVVIIHHPLSEQFSNVNHPSYAKFYNEVLRETTDIKEIEAHHESRFETDKWYSQLYSTANGYHGTHPIAVWSAVTQATRHLGGVIVVGGNQTAADRLGFRHASNFADAMELARDIVNKPAPTHSFLHAPPAFMVDVHQP